MNSGKVLAIAIPIAIGLVLLAHAFYHAVDKKMYPGKYEQFKNITIGGAIEVNNYDGIFEGQIVQGPFKTSDASFLAGVKIVEGGREFVVLVFYSETDHPWWGVGDKVKLRRIEIKNAASCPYFQWVIEN